MCFKGRKRYLAYLGWLHEDDAGKKMLEFDRLSKDWAIGARGFKKALLQEHQHLEQSVRRGEAGPREISTELWQESLRTYLAVIKKTGREIETDPKGAAWKVAVAAVMKTRTTASNPWLAEQLRMGSPFRLSRLVSACRANSASYQPYFGTMTKCKV